ncbi:MAG: hypothetical protein HGA19_20545 [Oscillochloris sp.]|nr:hypothetical protein [Oscillochloris sp.]
MATSPVSDTTQATNNLIEAASTLAATLTRAGVALVSAPLSLLPAEARTDAVKAAGALINTVGSVHLSILKAAVSGVNAASVEVEKALKDVNVPGVAVVKK